MIFINDIKDNWPKYRCNPTVMPFASFFGKDPVNNFSQCIQNMQSGFMSEFLEPVYYIINLMGSASKEMMKSIEDVKSFVDNMQGMVGGEFGELGGIIRKVQIAFQGILIGMMDTFSRIGGILMVFVEMLKGSMLTIRTGFEVCFHPDTLVNMNDGTTKMMKDISLGDTLADDNKVISTMKILPTNPEEVYYSINSKELNQDILVTGSHFILDETKKIYVPVKDYSGSVETVKKPETMCCLITESHNIPIGEHTFHDWEDEDVSKNYYLSKYFH